MKFFSRETVSFLALCAIWGTTWIGIKAGIENVPPLLFAGTRFVAAGLLLLLAARIRQEEIVFDWRHTGRILTISLLMISLCYGPLFWGMQYINSGMAGLLEMSLTPIALLLFALLLREEAWSARRAFAIALGVAGICLLFGPDMFANAGHNPIAGDRTTLGALAVASAAFTYALGSVLARPLLRLYPSFFVAGITTLVGGACLCAYSLCFEEGTLEALRGTWGMSAWAGWLFLVLFGSLIGYTIYMRLLRDIGASRAGAYAFVSPIIAVLLGWAILSERVEVLDVAGMLVMLIGAYMALFERTADPDHAARPAGDLEDAR